MHSSPGAFGAAARIWTRRVFHGAPAYPRIEARFTTGLPLAGSKQFILRVLLSPWETTQDLRLLGLPLGLH